MDEALDIRYILAILRRRWHIFAVLVVVLAPIGLAVAVLLPPVYVATGKILVESQQIPTDLVRSTVTTGPNERIQIIEQRLLSRANLLPVARKFDLQNTVLKGASTAEVVDFLRNGTTIEPVAKTGRSGSGSETLAFSVSFEDQDPNLAVNIANELVTLILDEDARSRSSRAAETTAFLEREAQRLTSEVEKADGEIAKYKQEHQDALPEQIGFRLTQLSNLQTRLSNIDSELSAASEEERLYALTASDSPGADGKPTSLDAQLEVKKAQLREISATYSSSHPKRRQLEREIGLLEKELQERTAKSAQIAQADETSPGAAEASASARVTPRVFVLQERRKSLLAERQQVSAQIEKTQRLIDESPNVGLGLANLTRGLEATKSKLDEVWRKHADAQLGERLEDNQKGERFELIEPPTLPTAPVKPNRKMVLAIGMVLAFGAGGSGVVVTEMLDRSIRSVSDLANKLNVRPLVVLPVFVTREEVLARRRRLLLFIAGLVGALLAVLAALHFLYMPLDDFIQKLVERLLS